MNIKRIIRIAFILIGISIAGNAVLFVMGESPFNLAKIEEKHLISAKNIRDIEVSSNIGDVTVQPHESDKIEVRMEGKIEKKNADNLHLSVTNENNNLKVDVKEKRTAHLFSIFSGDYYLIVKLPKKEFQLLQVNTDAASITLNEIKADHVELSTDMGDIFIRDVVAAVSAKSDVGDIEVHVQNIEKDITAKSDVGDITVKTKEQPKQLRTQMSNSIGEEIVKLPNLKNGSIGNGGPLVFLKSDVGDVALMMHDE
jgi:Putative adhesin